MIVLKINLTVYLINFLVFGLVELLTNWSATPWSVIKAGMIWPAYVRIGLR
jgi:hypothetical protein